MSNLNLGSKVSTRNISWDAVARDAWGSEFSAPDHDTYKMSNGRGFDSTDLGHTGIYNDLLGVNYLMIDTHYLDATSNDHLLQLSGSYLLLD